MNSIYCDLDGTFIKGDLEREFVKFLQRTHKFNWYHYLLAAISMPINKIQSKRCRGSLFKSWTYRRSRDERYQLYEEFLQNKNDELLINEKVLLELEERKATHKIILLTGSFEELVRFFMEKNGKTYIFDEIIGCQVKKRHTFFVKRHPYGKDKCKFIHVEEKIVGIANEYVDRFYLQMCDEVFIVNAEEKLCILAKKLGWRNL